MNDAFFMCGFQRFSNLQGDTKTLIYGEPSSLQPVCKSHAFNQLEDEERAASAFLYAVDCSDVGMIYGGEQPCLPIKTHEPFGIRRERRPEHFDCNVTSQLGVTRPVNFTHSALTKRR